MSTTVQAIKPLADPEIGGHFVCIGGKGGSPAVRVELRLADTDVAGLTDDSRWLRGLALELLHAADDLELAQRHAARSDAV